ncbi:TetR/AcrR family transcriptional regulator, partial [Streptomyces sp. NPDC054771]
MPSSTSARPPGRPRTGINATVFAATLSTVRELGYARATVERIAAAAGIAKSTVYRRWPSKGELIVDCLLDALGPAPLEGGDRAEGVGGAQPGAAAPGGAPGGGVAGAGVVSAPGTGPARGGVRCPRG